MGVFTDYAQWFKPTAYMLAICMQHCILLVSLRKRPLCRHVCIGGFFFLPLGRKLMVMFVQKRYFYIFVFK